MENKPKFNIGDTAYYVFAGNFEKKVPCYVCNGKRFITVIDGYGEEFHPECEYCNDGLGTRPTGLSTEHEFQAIVDRIEIDSVSRNYEGEFEYNHRKEVYATKEEAEEEGKRLVGEAARADSHKRNNLKDYSHKKWSWHVGYHKRNIKKAEKDLEYHTTKLSVAKMKSKDKEDV
jgi:hypothetical protein